jgi:hypothetical protein
MGRTRICLEYCREALSWGMAREAARMAVFQRQVLGGAVSSRETGENLLENFVDGVV